MVLQAVGGLAIIAALLAVNAVALYAIWWIVMIAVGYVPMIGRKHRHAQWDRLNRDPRPPRPR